MLPSFGGPRSGRQSGICCFGATNCASYHAPMIAEKSAIQTEVLRKCARGAPFLEIDFCTSVQAFINLDVCNH